MVTKKNCVGGVTGRRGGAVLGANQGAVCALRNETQQTAPGGQTGQKGLTMSTQKRNNKYDGMDNKEQIIARILEDVKSFFGPQDEKFAESMYEELVANGTIKEK